MNVAKIHSKTRGLAKYALAIKEIHSMARAGVASGNVNLFVDIRVHAEHILGGLIDLETELEKMDEDSPCLTCGKIKGGI
jgi:hypothetical protein